MLDYNINSFLTFIRQKNGQIKVIQDVDQIENVYKLLYELGVRKTNVGKKQVFYRRIGSNIMPMSFQEVKDSFKNFLIKERIVNMPEDIKMVVVLNWFYKSQSIKIKNDFFDFYLIEELSDEELNKLKKQIKI